MKILKIIFLAVFMTLFLGGCVARKAPSTSTYSTQTQNLKDSKISNTTLKKLASDSTKKLLASKKISKQNKRFAIVGITQISCKKECNFDKDFLRKKIKVGLIHSGKMVVIDAPDSDKIIFTNNGISKVEHANANSIYSPDYILSSKMRKNSDGVTIFEMFLKEIKSKKEIWTYKKEFNGKF